MSAGAFLIIVDNLEGTRAYEVESFTLDTHHARLIPVFDDGKTPRDFSSFTSFRLVAEGLPEGQPWLWESAQRLLEHPEPRGLTTVRL